MADLQSLRIINRPCFTFHFESFNPESSFFWYASKSSDYLGHIHVSRSSVKVEVTEQKSVCVSCSRVVCLGLKGDLVGV